MQRAARAQRGRAVVLALIGLAVFVQVFVWGTAPAQGGGGSLLPQLRWLCGVGYAAVLMAAELALCAWFRLAQAATAVVVTGAAVAVVFWAFHAAGVHFATGAAAALTSAFAAVVLGAGLLTGWFRPPPTGR